MFECLHLSDIQIKMTERKAIEGVEQKGRFQKENVLNNNVNML